MPYCPSVPRQGRIAPHPSPRALALYGRRWQRIRLRARCQGQHMQLPQRLPAESRSLRPGPNIKHILPHTCKHHQPVRKKPTCFIWQPQAQLLYMYGKGRKTG